jgi:hypothetical protein
MAGGITVLQDAALQFAARSGTDLSTGIRCRIIEGRLDAFCKSPWMRYG